MAPWTPSPAVTMPYSSSPWSCSPISPSYCSAASPRPSRTGWQPQTPASSSFLKDPSPRPASWLARLPQGWLLAYSRAGCSPTPGPAARLLQDRLLAFPRTGCSSSRRPDCSQSSATLANILKALGFVAGTIKVFTFVAGIIKVQPPLLQHLSTKASASLAPSSPLQDPTPLALVGRAKVLMELPTSPSFLQPQTQKAADFPPLLQRCLAKAIKIRVTPPVQDPSPRLASWPAYRFSSSPLQESTHLAPVGRAQVLKTLPPCSFLDAPPDGSLHSPLLQRCLAKALKNRVAAHVQDPSPRLASWPAYRPPPPYWWARKAPPRRIGCSPTPGPATRLLQGRLLAFSRTGYSLSKRPGRLSSRRPVCSPSSATPTGTFEVFMFVAGVLKALKFVAGILKALVIVASFLGTLKVGAGIFETLKVITGIFKAPGFIVQEARLLAFSRAGCLSSRRPGCSPPSATPTGTFEVFKFVAGILKALKVITGIFKALGFVAGTFEVFVLVAGILKALEFVAGILRALVFVTSILEILKVGAGIFETLRVNAGIYKALRVIAGIFETLRFIAGIFRDPCSCHPRPPLRHVPGLVRVCNGDLDFRREARQFPHQGLR